jgi:hypothetical protein
MIRANATLEPVTAKSLGEWGGGKAYSASELAESCSICVLFVGRERRAKEIV